MKGVELRKPPRLSDWETFHNTIYSDSVACYDVLIELSSLLGGFSLSPASALRLIFLTNELQVIKSHKRLEKSVKSQANETNDSQSFS